MRHDEERQSPRIPSAPVARCLVRPASPDHCADTGDRLLEPRRVLAVFLAPWLLLVCPGAAKHPVVEALASLAEIFSQARRPEPAMYPSTDVVIDATTFAMRILLCSR